MADKGGWPTWPKPDQPDFTHVSRKVKEVTRSSEIQILSAACGRISPSANRIETSSTRATPKAT